MKKWDQLPEAVLCGVVDTQSLLSWTLYAEEATADPQRAAQALGLRKIGDESVQPDNDQTKGKVAKIVHLVEVVEA